ncbi:MAG: phospholipase D-like domain-containing protein [Bacteroidales bacterium]|nr:phospholipase D-like domain-containing protein [Bacteroidales bacterium]
MLQLLKTPTENVFFENLKTCNDDILLCAPYIKKNIIQRIIREKSVKANLKVITTANIASFVRGASDIEAIEELIDSGIKVINHQHLHAKIYVFGKEKAIITSANLTYNGLNRNYEYGVMIDDKDIVDDIDDDCSCLIDDELSGEFDLSVVNDIKNQIYKISKIDYKIITDEFCDEKIKADLIDMSNMMSGWQKEIFDIVAFKLEDEFTINDIYAFESDLYKLHQNNKNIKPKIRQILQNLRDRGLIKFVDLGKYKKLFIK